MSFINAPADVETTPLNSETAKEIKTAVSGAIPKYSSKKSFYHVVIPPLKPVKLAFPKTISIYIRIEPKVLSCDHRLSFSGGVSVSPSSVSLTS